MVSPQYIENNSMPVTETGCWLWMQYVGKNGYGQLSRGSKLHYLHRLSYEVHKGPIPMGMHILHSCDVRSCVNPAHLAVGTNQDNIFDSVKKGRRKRAYKPRPEMVGRTWNLKPEICERRRKLKSGSYVEVFALKESGWSTLEIGKRFGVSASLIFKVLRDAKQ